MYTCHGFAVSSNLYQFLDRYRVQAIQPVGYSPAWVCVLPPQGHDTAMLFGQESQRRCCVSHEGAPGIDLSITVNDTLAHLIVLVSTRFHFCNITISSFITDWYFMGTSAEIMPVACPSSDFHPALLAFSDDLHLNQTPLFFKICIFVN